METLTLKFTAPKTLEAIREAQPMAFPSWYYDNTDNPLELDTSDWTIRSEEYCARIDLWMVNQDLHAMRVDSGEEAQGFEPLDYPFAVSMIGQIAGKDKLLDYLQSLQEVFSATQVPNDKPTEQENTTSDQSKTSTDE